MYWMVQLNHKIINFSQKFFITIACHCSSISLIILWEWSSSTLHMHTVDKEQPRDGDIYFLVNDVFESAYSGLKQIVADEINRLKAW